MSFVKLRPVHTTNATAPHGHYVQAMEHAGLLYVSGLLGNSLREHVDAERNVTTQAAHCMEQLVAILLAAGSGLDSVIKMSVYVADIAAWPSVDQQLATQLGAHRPARIVVPAGTGLRYDSAIEIDAIAAAGYRD